MSTLIHPELIALYRMLHIADIDFEDNRGSSNAYEFVDRARAAQKAFRERKAELEAAGARIWDDVTPNAEVSGCPIRSLDDPA